MGRQHHADTAVAALGIGLIGLGRHGTRYVRHLREFASDATLIAVSRRDARQGAAFAAEHGVRFHHDYHELIADPDVDVVIVVTPPVFTSSICMAAIQAKKPLLIEKPLACTGAVAKVMAEAAETAGVPLMTAHTLRFDSAVQALKMEVSKASRAQYVALTYRIERNRVVSKDPADYGQRGILLEIGTHLFDLIRFLMEDEVVEVRCELDYLESKTTESRALVSLRTRRNVSCIVDVSWVSTGRVSRVEWIGSDAHMSADWVQHRLCRIGQEQHADEWSVPPCYTVAETIRAFLAALMQGGPMPITGWDGYKAVAIADACYESAKIGRVVRLVG
ncbi:MAG TPA: Gfo/Idh/MocA family oxidoreductase [Nitrospiraceae bacterium]|nr:Gfo/Idh/MocA family oxidoreductase [Nitrospiraceae bacterium]